MITTLFVSLLFAYDSLCSQPPNPPPCPGFEIYKLSSISSAGFLFARHPDIGKHFKSFSNERLLRQFPGPELCQRLAFDYRLSRLRPSLP